jgi:hypothetical protein
MKVAKDLPTCSADATLMTELVNLSAKGCGCLLMVQDDGKLTVRDIKISIKRSITCKKHLGLALHSITFACITLLNSTHTPNEGAHSSSWPNALVIIIIIIRSWSTSSGCRPPKKLLAYSSSG